MKILPLALGLAALSIPVAAQGVGDISFRIDGGASLVEDYHYGPVTYSFNPGVRFDLVPTFNLNEYCSVNFETGIIWNGLDKVSDGHDTVSVEGDQLQVPFLLEGTLRLPLRGGITPYIGGGGGGVYMYNSVDRIDNRPIYLSSDDFWGAVQGFAGIQYEFNRGMNVGVVYKYLHVFSEGETDYYGFRGDDTVTHSISLTFILTY